ncbi:MAG TPA: phosphatase PAP2 family protein [Adhaeribacter sp.]|nr:phosphatase PAP2 family protein [Adhaeribacter sp.]
MKHFFGLPFTLILILAWINLAMLSELSEAIVNSPGMKTIDGKISLAFYKFREPWLSKAFYWFTALGDYYGLLTVSVLASLFMLYKRKPHYLLGFLVSLLGSGLAVRITKAYFVRERPLDIGYYTETSFSFPSGHATGGMALEGFLCYLLIIEAKTPKKQLFWLIAGLTFNFLMGISRIYLGVHFASDVLAGWLLGFLWLLFGIVIMEFATLRTVTKKVPENEV